MCSRNPTDQSSPSAAPNHYREDRSPSITIHMITILTDNCNPISQKNYDNLLSNLNQHQLTCTCGHSACLIRHGYYKRKIKSESSAIVLRIRRVICSICNTTHAILPEYIIPYSQISHQDQVSIISCFENATDLTTIMEENPTIDESNVRYVIKQYIKHWAQRILAMGLSATASGTFIKQCFSCFNRQFMQIKRTPNILFLKPT